MSMTNLQAKARMKEYLKSHFIEFHEGIDNGTSQHVILYRGYDNCPDKVVESCIWYYPDYMECRVYYDCNAAEWCRKSEYRAELIRFLNFCNARIWPCTNDGMDGVLYKPNYLYTPRFYITEDGCYDITITNFIPLDFYAVCPLETEDFLTAACPDLLNKLSPSVFFILLGKITAEQAISIVKKDILCDED